MDPATMFDAMYGVEHYRYGTEPNAFLASMADEVLAPGSRVLVVGDGEGRNGVWLAAQGHEVVTVDASAEGVRKAKALAAARGVAPDIRQGMFPDAVAHEAPFDAVVLTFIHVPGELRPRFHKAALDALKPGGVVLLEAFRPEQITLDRTSGGPPVEAMMFTPEQMHEDFGHLHDVRIEAPTVHLDEGPGHNGTAEVVRVVGRKPA